MDFKNFKPCNLIAMPELQDPNFQKAVVLLTDYHETGASGFVINRKTDVTLGAALVLEEGSLNPQYTNLNLWYGGPVDSEKIWIIYDGKTHSNETDTNIGDNIMIAQDIDILVDHKITLDTNLLRIFHGYSGWGSKQLDSELANSAWITSPLSHNLLFDTHQDKIWQNAIKDLGFDPDKLIGPNSPFLN